MKPKSKKEAEHPASFGRGGPGHMFSKQASGPVRPGVTGKTQNKAPGAKAAAGGPQTRGVSLATPAKPGRTAPVRKDR
jgi:hypothetical protein